MTTYAQAAKTLRDAQQKVHLLQAKAAQLAADLRNPDSLNPAKINEHSWPSRDEVLKTIQEWKTAKHMEFTMYDALPKDEKAVTMRPDGVLPAMQSSGRLVRS